ncbi:hypothetical protein ACHAWF_018663, partial [Thalassiosira exigua]
SGGGGAREASWEKALEALRLYISRHGHANVPQKEGALGRWVNNQRQFKARRDRGEKMCLTDERIKALDELGFAWNVKANDQKKKEASKSTGDDGPTSGTKRAKPTAAVSTRALPDGTQVIEGTERYAHPDGGSVEV